MIYCFKKKIIFLSLRNKNAKLTLENIVNNKSLGSFKKDKIPLFILKFASATDFNTGITVLS